MQATKQKAAEIFFRRLVFFKKPETAAVAGDGLSQVVFCLQNGSFILAALVHHMSTPDQQRVD